MISDISLSFFLLIKLQVESLGPLLDIIEGVEGIHELHHALGVLLVLRKVTFNEEGQRQEVENIFIQFVRAVSAQVMKQL